MNRDGLKKERLSVKIAILLKIFRPKISKREKEGCSDDVCVSSEQLITYQTD